MAKIELNDRIELSDIFADCTHAGSSQFFTDNESLSFTIDPNDILPPRFTNLTNYPLYVVGVNQQTNVVYEVPYIENQTYGTDWDMGYYRIYIKQYIRLANNGHSPSALYLNTPEKTYDLTKKPIYWNKSPFQFMTYINSGSFEMGFSDKDLYDFRHISSVSTVINYNMGLNPRINISITKPFFIGRTLTTNLFYESFDPRYISGQTLGKNTRCFICKNITLSNGIGSGVRSIYFTNGSTKIISTTYYTDNLPSGYTTSSLNNDKFYLLNSSGKDSNGNITTTTNHSFIENLLSYSASLDDSECTLKNQGWIWNLPTEAQWEYACRAGTSTQYPNGTNINKQDVTNNIFDHSSNDIAHSIASLTNNEYYCATLKPNKYGLFDMNGLIYELTKDSGYTISDISNNPTLFAGSPYYNIENQLYVTKGGQHNQLNGYSQYSTISPFRYVTSHIGDSSTTNQGFRLTIVQP